MLAALMVEAAGPVPKGDGKVAIGNRIGSAMRRSRGMGYREHGVSIPNHRSKCNHEFTKRSGRNGCCNGVSGWEGSARAAWTRARATRWRSPPLSSAGMREARAPAPTWSSNAPARRQMKTMPLIEQGAGGDDDVAAGRSQRADDRLDQGGAELPGRRSRRAARNRAPAGRSPPAPGAQRGHRKVPENAAPQPHSAPRGRCAGRRRRSDRSEERQGRGSPRAVRSPAPAVPSGGMNADHAGARLLSQADGSRNHPTHGTTGA